MIDDQSRINQTQRAIMEAAIACIEKYGIENVTVRRIAEEAGTNIASINYYFRSKKNLMDATLKMTVGHMLEDVIAAIDNDNLDLQQRLEEVFYYLIDGAIRYPKLSTAHLYEAIVSNNYDSPGVKGMRDMFEHLVKKVEEELPEQPTGKVRFLLAQILFSYIFLVLTPDFIDLPIEYNVNNPENHHLIAKEYSRIFFKALD